MGYPANLFFIFVLFSYRFVLRLICAVLVSVRFWFLASYCFVPHISYNS